MATSDRMATPFRVLWEPVKIIGGLSWSHSLDLLMQGAFRNVAVRKMACKAEFTMEQKVLHRLGDLFFDPIQHCNHDL